MTYNMAFGIFLKFTEEILHHATLSWSRGTDCLYHTVRELHSVTGRDP